MQGVVDGINDVTVGFTLFESKEHMSMTAVKKDVVSLPGKFAVVSVEKTAAPAGTDGDDWYRYVVECDNSQIVGNMRGTQQAVTQYASEFVENLNERARTPKGRSTWAPSPSQKTPPKKV